MGATIEIIKTWGDSGSPTESADTTFGLKSVDDHATAPADAPVTVPSGAGTNYSYECWLRFKCTAAPDNLCTDFKVWGPGTAIATGVVITINTDAVDTYVTPVDTESAQGTRGDLADHGTGAKIDVAGDLVNENDETDFLVLQLEVDNTAGAGDIPAPDFYYSYDET